MADRQREVSELREQFSTASADLSQLGNNQQFKMTCRKFDINYSNDLKSTQVLVTVGVNEVQVLHDVPNFGYPEKFTRIKTQDDKGAFSYGDHYLRLSSNDEILIERNVPINLGEAYYQIKCHSSSDECLMTPSVINDKFAASIYEVCTK
jgi:hypothetical protein